MFPVYPHAVAGEEKIKTGYRHQPRRGTHCAPACHFYETFCLWADASIGPCAGSYPQGKSKFLINLLHHPPQGFGTVKTVPYRALIIRAIPHNSKCRYGERGAADAKPKAQIIPDAAKVSAASGGNSEPKQGQWSQSARGFCPRRTMRVPQPDIIEHFGNADAMPQPPERCLSRQAGIVRCCLYSL